jgi:hypothetical protein
VGRRGCAVPEKQATPACLLTTTVVRADGTTHVERLALALAIDCFYVYPTISGEPTINANLSVGFRERKVATARAARFSQVCRVYAPVYRQITLSALDHPNRITGRKLAAGRRYGVAARERSLLTRLQEPALGVHVLDVTIALDDLVRLVRGQVADYTRH